MSYTKQQVQNSAKESFSVSECLRRLGRTVSGSSHRYMLQFIKENNIDISHFKQSWRILKGKVPKKPASAILVFNTDSKSRLSHSQLKRALIEIGRNYSCEICGLFEWRGNKNILQVDHINRNWRDNTSDNLRFLCPNCHVSTASYGNKKEKVKKKHIYKTKINWPTREEIERIVWQEPINKIAKRLCVSDNAIHKFCKRNNIQKPPHGYWLRDIDPKIHKKNK